MSMGTEDYTQAIALVIVKGYSIGVPFWLEIPVGIDLYSAGEAFVAATMPEATYLYSVLAP